MFLKRINVPNLNNYDKIDYNNITLIINKCTTKTTKTNKVSSVSSSISGKATYSFFIVFMNKIFRCLLCCVVFVLTELNTHHGLRVSYNWSMAIHTILPLFLH